MGGDRGRPLHERIRSGVAGPVPDEPPQADRLLRSGGRHCWVSVPVDGPRERPGLLLEWRNVGRGRWEGRVVYAAELRPDRWALVEEWVPSEYLSPRV